MYCVSILVIVTIHVYVINTWPQSSKYANCVSINYTFWNLSYNPITSWWDRNYFLLNFMILYSVDLFKTLYLCDMSQEVIKTENISLRINNIILNNRETTGRTVSFIFDPTQ